MTDVWGDSSARRREFAFDVVLASLFGLLMVAIHQDMGEGPVIATVLLSLALAVRRMSWQLMSALAIAAGLIQLFSEELAYLSNSAYAVLFFTLGRHPRAFVRRFGLACAVIAVLGAAGRGAVLGMGSPVQSRSVWTAVALGSMAAIVVFGGWISGYLRWQGRQTVQARIDAQIQALERRRVTELYDIEQERRRIAADMHDVVAHSWAVVAAQSDGARYALRDNPAQAEHALEVIGETARSALGDLRTIVAQLRDPALQPSTPGYEQQAQVVERMRESGMDLQLTETGSRDESPLVALTAHRLLGESLTNALKHGDLSRPVRVEIDWTDGYRLHVTNHLPTAAPTPTVSPTDGDAVGGHGLVGMSERTTIAGGTLHAGPEGDQWVVTALLPTVPREDA